MNINNLSPGTFESQLPILNGFSVIFVTFASLVFLITIPICQSITSRAHDKAVVFAAA